MTVFEYVMVLTSIVVGIGITHLLSGMGHAIYRMSGHGRPIRLDWIHGLWVVYAFVWLVVFWWWEFQWRDHEWTLFVYLFIISYAVGLFMICVVLVPAQIGEIDDFRQYFMSTRHWFFGLLFVCNGLDVIDTWSKGTAHLIGAGPDYAAFVVFTAVVCVVGWRSRAVPVHGAMAVVILLWQLIGFAAYMPQLE